MSAIPEDYLEERLLNGLFNNPFDQYKGLLDTLQDVDSRMLKKRTLLHVAASLGKLDWVEGLLGRGADTDVEDDSQVSPLGAAEEMQRRFPDDGDRREVLRLVGLIHRRDKAMRSRRESSVVGETACSAVLPSEDISAITALKASLDDLKAEISLLRAQVDGLKRDICGRDALLECIERAVTSSAEELTSLRGLLEASLVAVRVPPLPADVRRECIDAMMGRTDIRDVDEGKVTRVANLYEKLYDEDIVTASLLRFLGKESRLRVVVDCGYSDIRRVMPSFREFDGYGNNGSTFASFANFSDCTVYLGAHEFHTDEYIAGWFARALAQMSLLFAFDNGGLPYQQGDSLHEREFRSGLAEVEYGSNWGAGLDSWINNAVSYRTQSLKETHFAAIVPEIIASNGSEKGTSMLKKQVPVMFDLFKDHVVRILLLKAGA